MNLVLEIINTPAYDVLQRSMHFDAKGGKIGRSKNAKWTLRDPSKHISNFHAQVTFDNGKYYITDISTNGMFLKTPYKKFIKGVPMVLDQKSAIMIGDYVIAVKTIDAAFMNNIATPAPIQESQPSTISDDFFLGNKNEQAFSLIQEKGPETNDIVSMLGKDVAEPIHANTTLLPELDNIMGLSQSEEEIVINDSLATHIEPPTFNPTEVPTPPQESTATTGEDTLLKLLASKLGVDIHTINQEEQEAFVSQVAELVLTTLEQARNTQRSLDKIKSQLGIPAQQQDFNPIKTSPSTKEMLTNMHTYSQPLSVHVKSIFHEVDTHNIAFYTAFKNVSLRMSEKFSPEKLYYDFEKRNALSKSFTNKKAQAWEAYCEKFKVLDAIHQDDNHDFEELQKEYRAVLEIINLGYNK
ncbi:MAG TPA: type VI secretion system-associated FHA domain protein TagH [Sulfurovum sp.]|nr:type VI secretion system-associated FHA domain protein TagH [Sulfurovum sp.]